MRHLDTIRKAQKALIKIRKALVEAQLKDPDSSIHWKDYNSPLYQEVDDAISDCETYLVNIKHKM